MADASIWKPGSSVPRVNADATAAEERFVATAGQTLFSITTFSYTLGSKALRVFVNGVRQFIGYDYTETSTSSFTLTSGCDANDVVVVEGVIGVSSVITNAAAAVSFSPAGGIAAANVQLALEELDTDKASTAAFATVLTQGKETIWIPAGAMTPRITNGPSSGIVETTTNKLMLGTLDFDTTTAEYAQFTVAMPKSWNAGSVSFKALVSHASGTGNVIFSLAGISFASDEALDGTAFPTAVPHSALTVGTANDIYISAESAAVTITGAGKSEYVTFQVARDVSDTLDVDARLHGIQLFYTTDAANDA